MWRALKVAPASVPSNSKGLKQTSYQRASSFVQRESLPTMVRCSGTSHGRHPWREHHIVLYIQSWCSFLISFEKDLLKMSSRVRLRSVLRPRFWFALRICSGFPRFCRPI